MGRYLPEVQEAAKLHTQALQQELAGQYELAHTGFDVALLALHEADPQDPAVIVQEARIIRDDGFNTVRWALHEDGSLDGLAEAEERLEESRKLTAPFVDGSAQPFSGDVANFVSKHQRREILSEHAATLGLCARLVVARQVLTEEIVADQVASPAARSKQFQNGLAYDLAKVGTNQYYATSIAMNGARIEVINGRPLNSVVWIARADMSWFRALGRDRGNVVRASKTMFRIGFKGVALQDREKAMAAAINPKTV